MPVPGEDFARREALAVVTPALALILAGSGTLRSPATGARFDIGEFQCVLLWSRMQGSDFPSPPVLGS